MSVSPVGCPPKAEANRKSAEQRSTGHGSAMRDYCEADRAKRDAVRIRYAPLPESLEKSRGSGFVLPFSTIVSTIVEF